MPRAHLLLAEGALAILTMGDRYTAVGALVGRRVQAELLAQRHLVHSKYSNGKSGRSRAVK